MGQVNRGLEVEFHQLHVLIGQIYSISISGVVTLFSNGAPLCDLG